MTTVLTIPRRLEAGNPSEWFQAWRSVRDVEDLVLELPVGARLRPTGIVLLASSIAWREERKRHTSMRIAEPSGDAFLTLQRIDFFSELGVDLEQCFERHESAGRTVPLERILDLKTARSLAEETGDVLESVLPDLGQSPLRMSRFVFEELGANIVQHSGAPRTGFGMAQADPTERSIQIAFADAGVGFLQSLRRSPELAGRIEEDAEALQLAIGRAVSGAEVGRWNMGMGLALLVNFADLAGADLRIASGDALLHRRTSVGRERASVVRSIPRCEGSWICLEARFP